MSRSNYSDSIAKVLNQRKEKVITEFKEGDRRTDPCPIDAIEDIDPEFVIRERGEAWSIKWKGRMYYVWYVRDRGQFFAKDH